MKPIRWPLWVCFLLAGHFYLRGVKKDRIEACMRCGYYIDDNGVVKSYRRMSRTDIAYDLKYIKPYVQD